MRPDPESRDVATSGRELGTAFERLHALDRLDDVEWAERLVLLHAVHRDGAAATRAWLLGWSAATGAFTRALALGADEAAGAGGDWSARLEWARRLRPRIGGPEFRLEPGALDRAARLAWDGTALPPGGASPPWHGHAVHAVRLAHGVRPAGLLVAAFPPGIAAGDALASSAALYEVACERAVRAQAARNARERALALAELARAAVTAQHLAEADPLIVRHAAHGLEARGAALWRRGPDGGLRRVGVAGPCAQRDATAGALAPLAENAAARGRLEVLGPLDAGEVVPEPLAGVAAVALAPLLACGVVHGVLAVWNPAPAHPAEPAAFAASDLDHLGAIADLAAAMADQASRQEALRRGERERAGLRTRLRREEQLAAAGEAAARLAREARAPLASVAAFARRVHRTLEPDDPNRECLEIVLRETGRLEQLLAMPAEWTVLETPRLAPENLNAIAQEALAQVGETLVRRRVRMVKKLDPDLPALLLDPERIRAVVSNLVQVAVDEVAIGGRVRVESRRVREWAVFEVAHDGARAPGDLLDELFRSLAGPHGAEGGLGVAQRVVREHGGELRVRREREWSVVVTLTLPIPDNQDRRRTGTDRRSARADRRARAPGAARMRPAG